MVSLLASNCYSCRDQKHSFPPPPLTPQQTYSRMFVRIQGSTQAASEVMPPRDWGGPQHLPRDHKLCFLSQGLVASQLPHNIRRLHRHMPLPTAPNTETHFHSQHGQLTIPGPFIQTFRRESDRLSLVLVPLLQQLKEECPKNRPICRIGERILLKRYDEWQGLVSLVTFITRNTSKMCH